MLVRFLVYLFCLLKFVCKTFETSLSFSVADILDIVNVIAMLDGYESKCCLF